MAQSNPAEAVRNLFQTPELKSKIGFTLLALVIYRLGAHVTAPGIDVRALIDFFQNQQGGLAGLYDLFTGGGLSRATVFALGIVPYISASIVFQIMAAVIPTFEKMQREEEGRNKITQYTRYLTVAIAVLQAWGYALFTEGLQNAVFPDGTRELGDVADGLPHVRGMRVNAFDPDEDEFRRDGVPCGFVRHSGTALGSGSPYPAPRSNSTTSHRNRRAGVVWSFQSPVPSRPVMVKSRRTPSCRIAHQRPARAPP